MTLSGLQVTSFDCQSVAVAAPLSPNVLNTIWNIQNTAHIMQNATITVDFLDNSHAQSD